MQRRNFLKTSASGLGVEFNEEWLDKADYQVSDENN